jgi:hypothetical protein
VFIARDLDDDNRMLVHARKISAVLHHEPKPTGPA